MQCDDIEQYGRRLCLRVDDIPIIQNDRSYPVEEELRKEFNSMGVNIPHHAIDRALLSGVTELKYTRRGEVAKRFDSRLT